jgi:hypothetical protein
MYVSAHVKLRRHEMRYNFEVHIPAITGLVDTESTCVNPSRRLLLASLSVVGGRT